jgi:hypothetical protein
MISPPALYLTNFHRFCVADMTPVALDVQWNELQD